MHGEAIAVGLITEGFIAHEQNMLSIEDFESMCKFIRGIYGKVSIQEEDLDSIARLTLQDKKNRDNKILCVLQSGLGKAKWDCEITLQSVIDALKFYRTL